ncbi:MAG: hypothetical protein HQK50_07765 [Oligoflexia bacterium]|nr:hypothetical protein [Oligoflexia bacterium]MBF0365453.1 hypothetical protein [Oligoflexia bacterium]
MKKIFFNVVILLGFCASFSTGVVAAPKGDSPIDWKLFFAQLFALEVKKDLRGEFFFRDDLSRRERREKEKALDEKWDYVLRNNFVYTPLSFDYAEQAVKAGATTSEDLYWNRRKIFEDPKNREFVKNLNFNQSISKELQQSPAIKKFLDAIEKQSEHAAKKSGEDFFESEEAKNMIWALTYQGAGASAGVQKVALVFVPGFAAHTIGGYIFEELPISANRYYGREGERPIVMDKGAGIVPVDYREFYRKRNEKEKLFDVLHPVGIELGNTFASNDRGIDFIKDWLLHLPEDYKDTKFILLGYSKGAPIVIDMLKKYPELQQRVLGVVTYAGVLQGTGSTRSVTDKMKEISGGKLEDFEKLLIEKIKCNPEIASKGVTLAMSGMNACLGGAVGFEPLRELLQGFGVDLNLFEERLKGYLEVADVGQVLRGIIDLSNYERIRGTLLHLNDKNYAKNLFVMNLSAITDPSINLRPRGKSYNEARGGISPIVPSLTDEGNIDWKKFSLDAAFLYLSSTEGFKQAPGGLFDAQVELGNSKLLTLDHRPLHVSLTKEEMERMWNDPEIQRVMKERGIGKEKFMAGPRSELIPESVRKHIAGIDLGEILGHHWCAFKQAIKPPAELSKEYPEWQFPRMAYMRAMLQTLAFYNLYQQTVATKEVKQ